MKRRIPMHNIYVFEILRFAQNDTRGCLWISVSLFIAYHVAFYIETDDFFLGIAADGDGLSEMTREFADAVVSHHNLTTFARLDGLLGILRNGASA